MHRIVALSFLMLSAACDSGESSQSGLPGSTSSTTGSAPSEPIVAAVSVSRDAPLAVSPLFFGQNYWSWVPDWGDPVAAVEEPTARLELGLLRAGGANNDQQQPTPFSLEEIDGFVAFARAVGAEPLLQIPVLANADGAAASAAEAAALVEYVNQTQGYDVRYFSIGNEPDLYEEQGFEDAGYSASDFCQTYLDFSAAMKAVDPSILLVGPDLSWKYQSGQNDWLTPFLSECGDAVDILAVHRYPLAPSACDEAAAYGDADEFRASISHLKKLMEDAGQGDKPLAITEANITWDGEPSTSTLTASPGTFPAALWLADNLGVALEERLHNVSYWSLSEGWTLGFFEGATPRPALHVLELFSTRFGSEVLSVSEAPAGISIYAGRDPEAERTSVFVVNKTEQVLELEIAFSELPEMDGTWSITPKTLAVLEFGADGTRRVTRYDATLEAPETTE